jgi:predicted transcriptional regulator
MTINIYNHLVKSPEGCFKRDIIDGYGLSRVEADVLWNYVNDFVKEHYLACRFDNQIIFYAVSVEEPAGKPIKDCRLIPVNLTLYSHTDQKIKAKLGISALRESLATRLSEEAHHQGGLLSQADLAEILIVDKSTVKRIVKRIKTKGGSIPTRGEIKDIGPGISHKARIIELLLKRYQPTEVALKTKHSLSSITRYFENFIKVVYLHDEGFSLVKIRHLTGTSEKVVGEYLKIYTRCKGSEDYTERLEEIKGYLSSKKRGLL